MAFTSKGLGLGRSWLGGEAAGVLVAHVCVCVRGLRASFCGRFKGRKENLHFVRPLG